jgi:hypothetical protein
VVKYLQWSSISSGQVSPVVKYLQNPSVRDGVLLGVGSVNRFRTLDGEAVKGLWRDKKDGLLVILKDF